MIRVVDDRTRRPTEDRVRGRLAMMMALLYAVQGAWYPLLAVHLKDLGLSGEARGLDLRHLRHRLPGRAARGRAARRPPDRRRPADGRLIYAVGAALLGLIATGWVDGAGPLFLVFLVYWMIVAPASGLGNAIALRNLAEPPRAVRRGPALGDRRLDGRRLAGGGGDGGHRLGRGRPRGRRGVRRSAPCWRSSMSGLLPAACRGRRPWPRSAGRGLRDAAADAVALVRRPIVGLYLLTAFGVTLTLPYMFQVQPPYLEGIGLPRPWIAPAMTLGQVPEIARPLGPSLDLPAARRRGGRWRWGSRPGWSVTGCW